MAEDRAVLHQALTQEQFLPGDHVPPGVQPDRRGSRPARRSAGRRCKRGSPGNPGRPNQTAEPEPRPAPTPGKRARGAGARSAATKHRSSSEGPSHIPGSFAPSPEPGPRTKRFRCDLAVHLSEPAAAIVTRAKQIPPGPASAHRNPPERVAATSFGAGRRKIIFPRSWPSVAIVQFRRRSRWNARRDEAGGPVQAGEVAAEVDLIGAAARRRCRSPPVRTPIWVGMAARLSQQRVWSVSEGLLAGRRPGSVLCTWGLPWKGRVG